MAKLFISSTVANKPFSRFYKISHDDLLTTEDLNLISNEIDKVHDELIESIDTLESTKLGLEHLSKAYESISTNSKLCLDELDLAREELGYEGSIVNIINTNVTKEDLSNFTRKVFTAIKHVIERLVQLVKKFIDYIAKLFYNDKELEEKYENLSKKTTGREIKFSSLFGSKVSTEEFENTKLVKAREQLVFYSWPYFAVTNNLGKVLDSLRYDLDISEAALVNILRDRRAMFDDLAASLRLLKEKLQNKPSTLSHEDKLIKILDRFPECNDHFDELLRINNQQFKIVNTTHDKFDRHQHLPLLTELKDYRDNGDDYHYATIVYSSLKSTITHGLDKVPPEVNLEVYIERNKLQNVINHAIEPGVIKDSEITEKAKSFFRAFKDVGAKIKGIDESTADNLQEIVEIVYEYERSLKDYFISKENLDYINTVRDFTIQHVKSIAYITKYYSKRLSNFYNVYRIIYKPLVEEIERSK